MFDLAICSLDSGTLEELHLAHIRDIQKVEAGNVTTKDLNKFLKTVNTLSKSGPDGLDVEKEDNLHLLDRTWIDLHKNTLGIKRYKLERFAVILPHLSEELLLKFYSLPTELDVVFLTLVAIMLHEKELITQEDLNELAATLRYM